uniref:Uncharacterized protein n=1 Tax=Oryza brachyantha TaxID=4533 RepID=J3L2P9_ORYBR
MRTRRSFCPFPVACPLYFSLSPSLKVKTINLPSVHGIVDLWLLRRFTSIKHAFR